MKNFLIFMSGLVIGGGVSWVYHKNKYEEIVQEEVESLREHMKNGKDNTKSEEPANDKKNTPMDEEEFNESMEKVEKIITTSRYDTALGDKEEDITNKYKRPFVVTPDEFASLPGFDTDSFYYHSDDIIANGKYEMLEEDEIVRILGMTTMEIKEEFGVNEDDAVYIRNMRLKCDYEILRENEEFVRRNGD